MTHNYQPRCPAGQSEHGNPGASGEQLGAAGQLASLGDLPSGAQSPHGTQTRAGLRVTCGTFQALLHLPRGFSLCFHPKREEVILAAQKTYHIGHPFCSPAKGNSFPREGEIRGPWSQLARLAHSVGRLGWPLHGLCSGSKPRLGSCAGPRRPAWLISRLQDKEGN